MHQEDNYAQFCKKNSPFYRRLIIMDLKLLYLLAMMGCVGVIAGVYHLASGHYLIMSLISITTSLVFIALAYRDYRKGKSL